MGRRGRRPDPNGLAKGMKRAKERAKDGRPIAKIVNLRTERPECPDWVCATGKENWDWLIDNVAGLDVYAASDWMALATAAQALGMYIDACIELNEKGFDADTKEGGKKQSLAFRAQMGCHDQWRKWAIELGLTPASREGVRKVKRGGGTGSAAKSKAEKFG